MNTRAITRSALAVVGVAGVAISMTACGMLGGEVATAEVGECAQLADLQSDEITEIPTVDCSEEHDAQFFHKFDLPDGDFPGTDGVQTAAEEGCLGTEFENFVGTSYEESALYANFIGPTQETWDQADDREVLCIVFLDDGTTTTESFEGSGL
ncbi:septum formation family protein [Ruania halotolerans]|uniref:septum formation family protein n=1 Tax=Ruania halotolerans TaxID=2897773 RepID=UPI001E3F564B|nr:septum formation family protein [Ruania halotolerans]UFU05925.1 septum formation family protein [Ruania halotolerans]